MKKFVLITLMIGFAGYSLFAGNENTKTHKLYPRPPIYGIPAKTLPAGKFIYRSYFTFANYTQMLSKQSGEMVSLPEGMRFQNYSFTPKLRYGLTNKLTLIANFPFYYKHFDNEGTFKTGVGIGDVILAGLYRFYFNKQKKLLFSALLFTKYPTGKSTALSSDELPLGTGSFDAGLAVLPEKQFGKLDVRGAAFYIFRSKNRSDVKLGNVQLYYITGAYNFTRNIIAEGTLLHKTTGININAENTEIPNTNIGLTQLILGMQFRLAPTFLLQVAVPVTLAAKNLPFSSPYEGWAGIFLLL